MPSLHQNTGMCTTCSLELARCPQAGKFVMVLGSGGCFEGVELACRSVCFEMDTRVDTL